MNKLEKTALISSVVNLVLTILKFLLAVVTNSIALLAEAWHSLSDIFSSLIVFLALRADRKVEEEQKAEKEYRPLFSDFKKMQSVDEYELVPAERRRIQIFRSGNIEQKVAIGIGLFLLFVSYSIARKVIGHEVIVLQQVKLAAVVISILAFFSYLLYRFEFYIGEKNNSPGLIADGYHSKIDMLASVLVVVTLISDMMGLHIDKLAAIIICILIFTHAVHVLIRALKSYFSDEEFVFHRHIVVEDACVHFLKEQVPEYTEALYLKLACWLNIKGDKNYIRKKINLYLRNGIVFLAAIVYLLSGFYVVGVSEKAIVERFGRPMYSGRFIGPGLHYHLPWPIDIVRKVNTERIRRIIVGYEKKEDVPIILWTNIHYLKEYPFLTGEYSFINFNLKIHYKIKEIYQYLYNSQAPDKLLKNIAHRLVRDIMGKRQFFSTITVDRDILEEVIEDYLQKEMDRYSTGIEIVAVAFRDMHPPTDVAPAFEDVVSAHEDYETYIHEAECYRNQIIPEAQGEAVRIKSEAKAYLYKKKVESSGDAARFNLQLQPYKDSKKITMTRLYLETLEQTLSGVDKFIVYPREGEQKPEIWFYEKDVNPFFINNKQIKEIEK